MTGRKKMVIGWTVLCIGTPLFFLTVFALMESNALQYDDAITLSQLVVNVIYAWPPIVFLFGVSLGLVMGILTTHFLWPWVPSQLKESCPRCGKTILKEHNQ